MSDPCATRVVVLSARGDGRFVLRQMGYGLWVKGDKTLKGIRSHLAIMMPLPKHLAQVESSNLSLGLFVLRNNCSLGHLRHFVEYVTGPIQRDEALFIYSLVKTVDPKIIVEFEFYQGHSAFEFFKKPSLSMLRLYSYDISDDSM